MKSVIALAFLSILPLACTPGGETTSEEAAGESASVETPQATDSIDVNQRLVELGIELREPVAPVANYVTSVRSGNLVFLSGHGPDRPEGGQVTGKVGADLTMEEGQAAARLTGIALLSTLRAAIGDLNKVERIIKVNGMVNADPSFIQHPQVVNGMSDLMVDVFGERGKHARASVGMSSLPNNIAVEIDLIVQVRD